MCLRSNHRFSLMFKSGSYVPRASACISWGSSWWILRYALDHWTVVEDIKHSFGDFGQRTQKGLIQMLLSILQTLTFVMRSQVRFLSDDLRVDAVCGSNAAQWNSAPPLLCELYLFAVPFAVIWWFDFTFLLSRCKVLYESFFHLINIFIIVTVLHNCHFCKTLWQWQGKFQC